MKVMRSMIRSREVHTWKRQGDRRDEGVKGKANKNGRSMKEPIGNLLYYK